MLTPTTNTWAGWLGFVTLLATVVCGSMAVMINFFDLDTAEARRLADREILAAHSEDMGRLAVIERELWCLLWEVPAETCRATFNSGNQRP